MRRPEFTPHTWYNEDKTLMFRTDAYGMTDICPGPNSILMKHLQNYLTPKKYKPEAPQHIHWAFPPKDES